MSRVTFSSYTPISSETTRQQERVAISTNIPVRRTPNPGA
jgi:hypothetical protein